MLGDTCGRIEYFRYANRLEDTEVEKLLAANGREWVEEKKPEADLVKNRKARQMWRRSEDNQA